MSDKNQQKTGEITKIPIRLFCTRGGAGIHNKKFAIVNEQKNGRC